jgi:hypothetical protein
MSPVISHRFTSVIKPLAINNVFVRSKVWLREEKVFSALVYNIMSIALFQRINAQTPDTLHSVYKCSDPGHTALSAYKRSDPGHTALSAVTPDGLSEV